MYIPPKSYVLNLADTSLSFFDAFLVPSLADNAHREDILLIGPRHPVRPVDLACWFLHSDRSTNAFPWGPASPGTDLILRCPVPDEELDALDSGAIPYIGFTVQPDRTRPRTVVRATRPRSSETRRHYVSVHATIHGQVDRLPEWIEYHRMLGVEHFYIYDHDSVEAGYPPLRSYVESGVVSYVWWPLPGGRNEQSSFVKRVAMNHCLYKYGRYDDHRAHLPGAYQAGRHSVAGRSGSQHVACPNDWHERDQGCVYKGGETHPKKFTVTRTARQYGNACPFPAGWNDLLIRYGSAGSRPDTRHRGTAAAKPSPDPDAFPGPYLEPLHSGSSSRLRKKLTSKSLPAINSSHYYANRPEKPRHS